MLLKSFRTKASTWFDKGINNYLCVTLKPSHGGKKTVNIEVHLRRREIEGKNLASHC